MVSGPLWSFMRKTCTCKGFSGSPTAEEVTDGIDASIFTAIVTGATSGIGRETARVLALRGATVIMTARSMESGLQVRKEILEQIPNAKLEVMELDLSSLDSVRSFADSFLASRHPLSILINNAGIFRCSYQLSKDGIELHFATNHIGHFLLTNLLLDKLKATAIETGIQGRIVNVSSVGHTTTYAGGIRFDSINDSLGYEPSYRAYGQSKLANILHANELARLFEEERVNVTANSLHPGVIPTNVVRHSKKLAILMFIFRPFLKNIQQGAATTCYLALSPKLKGVSGKYFRDCNEVKPSAYASDADLAKRLWDFSEKLLTTRVGDE